MKAPFVIYARLDRLLENISSCHNDPENSSTTKIKNIHLLVIHCLHTVHLAVRKICLVITEVKIVWKNFVRR